MSDINTTNMTEQTSDELLKTDLSSSEGTRRASLTPNATADDELIRLLYKYKQLYDSGAITEEEYERLKNDLFNKHNHTTIAASTPKLSIIILWFCSICNLLGIVVNMIESLTVWGDLYSMYEYIMYGYIAGFIVIACFTPAIIVLSLKLEKHSKSNRSAKAAIIGGIASIALTAFLMVLAVFI